MIETMPSKTLNERVALVTGGARGIGLAITRHLHALGASVVVADNGVSISGENPDPAPAEAVVRELGSRAVAFTSDIANAENASAAVALARAQFGAIDLIVNNAAILRDSFIFKAKPANWDAVLRNNLSAAYYVLGAATPWLREQVKAGRAPGRIVNLTSTAGLYGNLGLSAYASAKAGLVGLTRVVAMDLARSKVTCNALAPFAATRQTAAIEPANPAQAQYKERASKIGAHFVAEVVGYLCSEQAQDISGQLFAVRGREVFLFSQPRPLERWVLPAPGSAPDRGAGLFREHFGSKLIELTTDLEAFNTEPVLEESSHG
jgi:NAD(P)-dependent dehydrogenase (short-subunit alcohol dehydrogenase family)